MGQRYRGMEDQKSRPNLTVTQALAEKRGLKPKAKSENA